MIFYKMQSLGNDFIVLDFLDKKFDLTKSQIKKISHRQFGIGCDQILILEKSQTHQANYRIFNSDGSEAEACGNGARCVGKYFLEKNNLEYCEFESLAGIIKIKKINNNFEINMGTISSPELKTITINNKNINYSFVSIGNPHGVIFVDNLKEKNIDLIGSEFNKKITNGINVGFCEVINKNNINLRVYERGVGETLACGSGACAAAVVGIYTKKLNNTVNIHFKSGECIVHWDGEGQPVLLTGPAELVYQGEIAL